VKAGFLGAIAKSEATSPLITPVYAVELLGTMMGGYNVGSDYSHGVQSAGGKRIRTTFLRRLTRQHTWIFPFARISD
jgi:aconitase B